MCSRRSFRRHGKSLSPTGHPPVTDMRSDRASTAGEAAVDGIGPSATYNIDSKREWHSSAPSRTFRSGCLYGRLLCLPSGD